MGRKKLDVAKYNYDIDVTRKHRNMLDAFTTSELEELSVAIEYLLDERSWKLQRRFK